MVHYAMEQLCGHRYRACGVWQEKGLQRGRSPAPHSVCSALRWDKNWVPHFACEAGDAAVEWKCGVVEGLQTAELFDPTHVAVRLRLPAKDTVGEFLAEPYLGLCPGWYEAGLWPLVPGAEAPFFCGWLLPGLKSGPISGATAKATTRANDRSNDKRFARSANEPRLQRRDPSTSSGQALGHPYPRPQERNAKQVLPLPTPANKLAGDPGSRKDDNCLVRVCSLRCIWHGYLMMAL